MFIEVADFLKCPHDHDFQPCVVVPDKMEDRNVVSGVIGCPVCNSEFPIRCGRGIFGEAELLESPGTVDASVLLAVLGLSSPGGYLALVGSVVDCWHDLAGAAEVHVIGINAPAGLDEAEGLSLLDTAAEIPLKSSCVRGVVLSSGQTSKRWFDEATRIVLPGQRVVAVSESVPENNLEQIALGHGMWVGKKTHYSE